MQECRRARDAGNASYSSFGIPAFLHVCMVHFCCHRQRWRRHALPSCKPRIAALRRQPMSRFSDRDRGAAIPQTARAGVRALGRLERPALIPDILVLFRHPMSEVRAEAANAVGQAAQGWKREKPANAAVDSTLTALIARLKVDIDPDVREALAETIGRLPYTDAAQAEKAEQALVDLDGRSESVTDRLAVAKGFEAFTRISQKAARTRPGGDRVAQGPGGPQAVGARQRRAHSAARARSAPVGERGR